MRSQDLEFVQENLQILIKKEKDLKPRAYLNSKYQINIHYSVQIKNVKSQLMIHQQSNLNVVTKSENMTIQMLYKEFIKQQNIFIDITKLIKNHKDINQSGVREIEMQNAKKQMENQLMFLIMMIQIMMKKIQQRKGRIQINYQKWKLTQIYSIQLCQFKNTQKKQILLYVVQIRNSKRMLQKYSKKILTEVARVVVDQVKMLLDIAENNINKSNTNVKEAVVVLDGAKVEHKQYMKKSS
ncbi:unnamed protein product [Paramecium pentaurelia]|uniref:Uncharacterized protein n=1 Tax=Paramecium pentaurelia TaxID=43138 RepID=A0A8S1V869_9CILI|nr:unnamed protein product [Paramecium pentaurelia]